LREEDEQEQPPTTEDITILKMEKLEEKPDYITF
jgi:hypothetical protein